MTENTITEAELKEKALEAIKKVYDPEIPVNIFELGLVYEISVFPINNVYVQMTLTSPSCPAAQSIPEDVKRFIKEIDGVNDVTVEITFDPPWTQELMSEVAKLELGFM